VSNFTASLRAYHHHLLLLQSSTTQSWYTLTERMPVTVDSNTVDPVEEFAYLGSIESSHSNSGPENIRRIGLAASAMERLDLSGVRASLVFPRSSAYTRRACYPYYSMAPRSGPSYKPIGKDWIPSMYIANDASCTSVGTTSCPTMKFCAIVARLRSDVPANLILRISTKMRDGERPSQEWRRTCGRLSTTWVHQICRDMGVTATEALLLAEDRPFWRMISMAGGFG